MLPLLPPGAVLSRLKVPRGPAEKDLILGLGCSKKVPKGSNVVPFWVVYYIP